MENKYYEPDCFMPEENVEYPLCIGKNLPVCENCQLNTDWEPDAYGID